MNELQPALQHCSQHWGQKLPQSGPGQLWVWYLQQVSQGSSQQTHLWAHSSSYVITKKLDPHKTQKWIITKELLKFQRKYSATLPHPPPSEGRSRRGSRAHCEWVSTWCKTKWRHPPVTETHSPLWLFISANCRPSIVLCHMATAMSSASPVHLIQGHLSQVWQVTKKYTNWRCMTQ